MITATPGTVSSLHRTAAYPLAGCGRTTPMRFRTCTVSGGIRVTFLHGNPFACYRPLRALVMIAEHTTSMLTEVFDEHLRHERGFGPRTLSLRSAHHPFEACTCMAQLARASPLRFYNPTPCHVLRGLVHDLQEAFPVCRSLATYRCRDRVLATTHYRYATRTETVESTSIIPGDIGHRPTRNIVVYTEHAVSLAACSDGNLRACSPKPPRPSGAPA